MASIKTSKTTQRLSKEERDAKEFISLGFYPHEGSGWITTAKRLLDEYNGKYYATSTKTDRFVVNTMFSLVNLMLPNLIFNRPYVSASAKQAKYIRKLPDKSLQVVDGNRAAEVKEASVNHKYQQIDAITEERQAIQDAFFYGFGVTKVGYSYETITEQDKDYVVKDSPFIKRVNPKDFGWHPLATNMADSTKLVHRSLTTLKKLKDSGKYDKSKLDLVTPDIPEYLQQKMNKFQGSASIKSDFAMLYEVHDQEDDKIYTYAGESRILIEKKDNPYDFNGPHFNQIRFAWDGENFEGISFLSMVEDEAMCLNEILTLMVQHYRKFPGQIFYDLGTMDDNDLERLKTGTQGSIHGIPSTANLKFQNPLSMGGEYFQIIQVLQNLVDRILGIPDFQRPGQGGSSRRSATEASLIAGDATIRRQYFLNLVREFIISDVSKMSDLQAQFQDETEEIIASGDLRGLPFKYNKEDIKGDFDLNFDIDELLPYNEAQAAAMNNLLTTLASQPILNPIIQTLDPQKMAKVLFKAMGKNMESMQKGDIETSVFVQPEVENAIARRGDPMPAPKKGEDHAKHLAVHGNDLQMHGPDEQILEHMAETMMLQTKEEDGLPDLGDKVTEQPEAPPVGPEGQPAPAGPPGPMQEVPQ